jgi:hypothetical protein
VNQELNGQLEIYDLHTGGVRMIDRGRDGRGKIRVSGDGERVATGDGVAIQVLELESGDELLYKEMRHVTGEGRGTGIDISWSGDAVYVLVQGSPSTIERVSVPEGTVTEVYRLKTGERLQGEFGVSRDGNRFVFRGNDSDRPYCVDVGLDSEVQYGHTCSPAISPSGTVLANNAGNHVDALVYDWPIGAAEPVEMRVVKGCHKWDNHHYSNDDRFYVGKGVIMDVTDGSCWYAGDFGSYCDLYVNNGAAVATAERDHRTGSRRQTWGLAGCTRPTRDAHFDLLGKRVRDAAGHGPDPVRMSTGPGGRVRLVIAGGR